jgi:hypothetical protein
VPPPPSIPPLERPSGPTRWTGIWAANDSGPPPGSAAAEALQIRRLRRTEYRNRRLRRCMPGVLSRAPFSPVATKATEHRGRDTRVSRPAQSLGNPMVPFSLPSISPGRQRPFADQGPARCAPWTAIQANAAICSGGMTRPPRLRLLLLAFARSDFLGRLAPSVERPRVCRRFPKGAGACRLGLPATRHCALNRENRLLLRRLQFSQLTPGAAPAPRACQRRESFAASKVACETTEVLP